MSIKIEVPRKALLSLCLIRRKNYTGRINSNTILVDIKKEYVNLVATDGHIMGVYNVKQENKTEGKLLIKFDSIAFIKNNKSSNRSDNIEIEVNCEEKNINLRDGNMSCVVELLEGSKYPNYIAAIPTELSNLIGHYDPVYIKKFADIFNVLTKEKHFLMIQNGKENAALLYSYKVPAFIGIIMPMNALENEMKCLPNWLKK